MRFFNKEKVVTSFWIEDYTTEDKAFFESIGFTENNVGETARDFALKNTLDFRGSGFFGT